MYVPAPPKILSVLPNGFQLRRKLLFQQSIIYSLYTFQIKGQRWFISCKV
jgi:hypothetical protein